MIEGMSVDDTSEKENAVIVCPVKDFFVMEREYNFIVGLSATSFRANDKQSPILLDDEKKRYIIGADKDSTAVEIASNNNALLAEKLSESLNTRNENAKVMMSYSYYDTINLRMSSPSVFFLNMSKQSEIKKAPGYENAGYIVASDVIFDTSDIKDSSAQRAADIRDKRENDKKKPPKDDGKKDYGISATGIQTMLACPLMYYYRHVRYLRIDDVPQPSGHEWLDPSKKGNLCHFFMDKYMSRVNDPGKGIDQVIFDAAFDEAVKEIEQMQPSYSDEVKEREKSFYKEKIRSYLDYVSKSWESDANAGKNWRVIGCELGFGKNDETGQLNPVYQGNGYTIKLDGSIDRVDGYIDQNRKLMLRIIDYKTGKQEKKKREIDEKIQIQHFLYAMALCEYIKSDAGKERINDIFGFIPSEYDFEWIGYTFPYEEDMSARTLDTAKSVKDNMQNGKVCFPKEIAKQLDDTIGLIINGQMEKAAINMNDYVEQKRLEKAASDAKEKDPDADVSDIAPLGLKDFCDGNYCKYKDICRKWIGYSEVSVEEEE